MIIKYEKLVKAINSCQPNNDALLQSPSRHLPTMTLWIQKALGLSNTHIPLAAHHRPCNKVILLFTQSHLAQQTWRGTCMKLRLAKINQETKILPKGESLYLSSILLFVNLLACNSCQ